MPFPQVEEACPHSWDDSLLTYVRPTTVVHRDECAYCCCTCLHKDGTYVCMTCHTGVCWDHIAKHMQVKPTHVMYTRIQEALPLHDSDEEVHKVRDVNYVAKVIPKEYETSVCCASCRQQFLTPPELTLSVYHGITHAPVPGVAHAQNDDDHGNGGDGRVRKPLCPHLISLEQTASPFSAGAQPPPTSASMCSVNGCGCTTNNWMCVTCGSVNCPRPESGGQGHARQHYLTTDHPCSVKLGTITKEGADFYCYACDDDVDDGRFVEHMTHFGIDLNTVTKTSKTMGELAYDYSSQFDFNKITEAGHALELAYGPGRTGIRNIGNICYLSSVVQCLMALAPFQHDFFPRPLPPGQHQAHCLLDPYQCRHCQMERIAAGLLSGQFSEPAAASELNGVSPQLFKQVYAQKHIEFATGAQQDAQEYLLYLLEELRRHAKLLPPSPSSTEGNTAPPVHPSQIFDFVTERRLECQRCHGVRYTYEKECSLSLFVPTPGDEDEHNDNAHNGQTAHTDDPSSHDPHTASHHDGDTVTRRNADKDNDPHTHTLPLPPPPPPQPHSTHTHSEASPPSDAHPAAPPHAMTDRTVPFAAVYNAPLTPRVWSTTAMPVGPCPCSPLLPECTPSPMSCSFAHVEPTTM